MKQIKSGLFTQFKIRLIFSLFFCLQGIFSFSQNLTLKGKVISEADGMSIIGASVKVDGTNTGTVTDLDGNFILRNAPAKGVLVFSYIGYKSVKSVIVKGKYYKISLKEDSKLLDEVVVVGYGTMTKKEVTGAVQRLNAEELTKTSSLDLGNILQGQIAGVSVQAKSGQPGEESNIQIRGLSSITGSSAPLYVVDGVPYDGDPGLNPSEIESLDVLKDAASAAIYGTRSSGGVILITTKKGVSGSTKVNFDSYAGIQHVTSRPNLMSSNQYMYVKTINNRMQIGKTDDEMWSSLKAFPRNFFNNNNLYDVVVKDNRPIQNYSLNIDGGNSGIVYNVSANYFEQDGVIINSDFRRYNLRANLNITKNKWNLNANIGLKSELQHSPGWGLIYMSYAQLPILNKVDPNVNIFQVPGQDTEVSNASMVMARLKQTTKMESGNYLGNFQAQYSFTKDFKLQSRLSLSYTSSKSKTKNPLFKIYDNNGSLVESQWIRSGLKDENTINTSYSWENMLNWGFNKKGHDLRLTGVFDIEQYTNEYFYASIKDLISNDVGTLEGGTNDMLVGAGTNQWNQDRVSRLVGMLGRLQYNYKYRYMLSASLRRDGSTRFSKKNRWGYFPSLSLGWNMSEEKFFKPLKKTINSLKLRLSYGTTGNQNFADYAFLSYITNKKDYIFGGEQNKQYLGSGSTQTDYSNSEISWETTQQANIGFDASLLNNKVTFTADVFQSNKKNMLFPLMLPPSIGSGQNGQVVLNIGDMQNKGVELALGLRDKIKKFNYNVNATFTSIKNKITNMGGDSEMYYFPDGSPTQGVDNVTVIKKGYEAGAFFMMPTDGIINTEEKLYEYQKLKPGAKIGDLRYVDSNGDGLLDDKDRKYCGSGMPDYELGLNLAANWMNFDISMNWYASVGNDIINGTKIYTYQNQVNPDLVYQWDYNYPISSIPTWRSASHDNMRAYADHWVEDGSFVRLKNIVLGYNFTNNFTRKYKIRKLRLYVAADNILTITKYDGYDPEVGSNGLSKRGLDYGTYPITAQIRGGIQLGF